MAVYRASRNKIEKIEIRVFERWNLNRNVKRYDNWVFGVKWDYFEFGKVDFIRGKPYDFCSKLKNGQGGN